jgi:PIN domain nuclease of toxin-antitoxin system
MILLDSHIAIWLLLDPDRLSLAAVEAIQQSQSDLAVPLISSVSFYEIARALHRNRIETALTPGAFLSRLATFVRAVPPDDSIALIAAQLPDSFPGDPMDRMIAATAISEGAPLVTADQHIRRSHAVKTIW